jgi:hypothetical protein
MRYLIFDVPGGTVVNTIIAAPEFVEKNYPGRYQLVEEPPPPPVYQLLSKVEFIRLCMSVGMATEQMVLDSRNDPSLAFMWLIFNEAGGVAYSDPDTQDGLEALHLLGYLPAGRQAVLDAWPTV